MLIAALGASAASQLYQSLKGQGTDSSATKQTTPARPPAAPAPAAGATLSDPAKKLVGDLNAFLLKLQATGASTGTSATPGSKQPASVPPSPLQIELQKLNEAARNDDRAVLPHHHAHAAPATSAPAAAADASVATATTGDTALAQFAKALTAYAANLGSTARTTQLSA